MIPKLEYVASRCEIPEEDLFSEQGVCKYGEIYIFGRLSDKRITHAVLWRLDTHYLRSLKDDCIKRFGRLRKQYLPHLEESLLWVIKHGKIPSQVLIG